MYSASSSVRVAIRSDEPSRYRKRRGAASPSVEAARDAPHAARTIAAHARNARRLIIARVLLAAAHRALHLALGVALREVLALVERLLAARDSQLHLHAPLREIER